jgi:hypothetical protein
VVSRCWARRSPLGADRARSDCHHTVDGPLRA